MKKEVKLMEKEKMTFANWIKRHKKELIIAGLSITAIIALIIGIKNRKALEQAWASLIELVEKKPDSISVKKPVVAPRVTSIEDPLEIGAVSTSRIPHDVAEHLRNLPKGWEASVEKIATAAEHGYNLLPGQTWVEAYRTGGLAA